MAHKGFEENKAQQEGMLLSAETCLCLGMTGII